MRGAWITTPFFSNLHGMIDVKRNRVLIEGKAYPLSAYRTWLSANHSELVRNHFVKAIVSEGKTLKTYDWLGVFSTAAQYNFHLNFRDDYQRDRTGSA
jgi:hypothetical protein